jgi:Zn-dependent peptidase ImmA (M78 family)
MTVLRARYNKIETITAQLLQKYKIKTPAIPVDKIAEGEGASILVKHFKNEISGLLMREGQHAIIAVERNQPSTRKRFTIAHELGHLMLHEGKEIRVDTGFRINLRSPDSSTAEDVEEIESNAFAASLLMPEVFLRRDLEDETLEIEDAEFVRRLSKRYDVSTQAMTLRLVNLLSRSRL